jgi:drug/metabolite transporter (DMT)-like permease
LLNFILEEDLFQSIMTKTLTKHSKALVLSAFAAIYIIWGSTYLAIYLAVKTIPPFFMAGTRFLIAGLILLIWALLKGEKLPDKKSILKISVAGILMLSFGNALVAWVEQYLASGLAAIIIATVPLWFVLLDKRQWKFYFSNKQIIFGLIIGFAGVILLFAGKSSADLFNDKMKFISLIVLLAATLSWTMGSLYSKYQEVQGSTLMKVAVQMTAAGIVIFIAGFAFNEQKDFSINKVTAESLGSLAFLILMGSLVAYLAYVWLLSIRPASLVGTYAYVNPVVAVFLGWLIADEQVSGQKIIGLIIIVAGLVIVNTSKEKKATDVISPTDAENTNAVQDQATSKKKV